VVFHSVLPVPQSDESYAFQPWIRKFHRGPFSLNTESLVHIVNVSYEHPLRPLWQPLKHIDEFPGNLNYSRIVAFHGMIYRNSFVFSVNVNPSHPYKLPGVGSGLF